MPSSNPKIIKACWQRKRRKRVVSESLQRSKEMKIINRFCGDGFSNKNFIQSLLTACRKWGMNWEDRHEVYCAWKDHRFYLDGYKIDLDTKEVICVEVSNYHHLDKEKGGRYYLFGDRCGDYFDLHVWEIFKDKGVIKYDMHDLFIFSIRDLTPQVETGVACAPGPNKYPVKA